MAGSFITSILVFVGKKKKNDRKSGDSCSTSSTISSKYIEVVIDKLRNKQLRDSTTENYLAIWRNFNKYLIRLDRKPKLWEDRTVMFLAYMIDNGAQSSTIRSYLCAIKSVLKSDGYTWNKNQVLLTSLTKACRLVNDTARCRLPISGGLLELLLFEVNRLFGNGQPYLVVLYQAIFALAYYGLLIISEITGSEHAVRACNIHLAGNKWKIMIMLYSSKTHGKESPPQKIKIEALQNVMTFAKHRFYCPFDLVRRYMYICSNFGDNQEQFSFSRTDQ